MNSLYLKAISSQLKLELGQVDNTIKLLEEGSTVPFIARYRKERTGSLNEIEVASIKRLWEDFIALDKRKETILSTIRDLGKLGEGLEKTIKETTDARFLEDLYAPYKPKKTTRAAKARALGLEPMAKTAFLAKAATIQDLLKQKPAELTDDEALAGVKDIIAENLSSEIRIKNAVRRRLKYMRVEASFTKAGAENPDSQNYRQFAHFRGCPAKMRGHELMALFRAENEGIISVKPDLGDNFDDLARNAYNEYTAKYKVRPSAELAALIKDATNDSLKRLIIPSIANEILATEYERAQKESVKVFSENLQNLLMFPPVMGKVVLALDPGFRTGCKVAVVGRSGEFLAHDVIYPHPPVSEKVTSIQKICDLVTKYDVEAIAIGSGTASRETEAFIAKVPGLDDINVYMVSEDGASIYSASDVAIKEFPDLDLTVRSAISIGRRLQDPLSELVKIDPKNLGVGQYQHDIDPKLLGGELSSVVERCVNLVGVNLNSASVYLLQYVSGIGPKMAQNIYEYRAQHGDYRSREELLNVPRLGAKAYEQCAGFLRIPGAKNPLDNSAVHPESYGIVAQMACDLGVSASELIANESLISQIDPLKYVSEEVGLPTLNDILSELRKPGRDPRGKAAVFAFSEEVHTIDDLREGMVLPGIVTNITAFGAFVDLGIKVNGLVSARNFPAKDKPKLRGSVQVKVTNVDLERNRISLVLV